MITVNLFNFRSFVDYADEEIRNSPDLDVVKAQKTIANLLITEKKSEWGWFACLVPLFFMSKIQAAVKIAFQNMGKLPSEPLKAKYRQIVNKKYISEKERTINAIKNSSPFLYKRLEAAGFSDLQIFKLFRDAQHELSEKDTKFYERTLSERLTAAVSLVVQKLDRGLEAFQLCLKEEGSVYSYLQKHLHLDTKTIDYLLSNIDAEGDAQLILLLDQLGFPVISLRTSTFNPLTFSLHILRKDPRFQNLVAHQGNWIEFVRLNYPNITIPEATEVKGFAGLIPSRDQGAIKKELLALAFIDEIVAVPAVENIQSFPEFYKHLSEIFSDEQLNAILNEMKGRVHGSSSPNELFRRTAIYLACSSDWLLDTGRLYHEILGSLKTDPSLDDPISLGSRIYNDLGKIRSDKAEYFEKHILTPAQKRVINPDSKIVETAARMYRDQLVETLGKPAQVSKSFQADIDQQIKKRSDRKERISTEQFAKDAHRFSRMRIFSEGKIAEFNDKTSTLEQVPAIYDALERLSSGDETLLLIIQEMSSQSPKNFAVNNILNFHSPLVSFAPKSTYQQITKESSTRFSFIYEFQCKVTNMTTGGTEFIPLVVQYVLEKRGDAWAMGQPEFLKIETEKDLPSNKNEIVI
jgi:hypothetical protein